MRYPRLLPLLLLAACFDFHILDGPVSSDATGTWNLRSVGAKPLPITVQPDGFWFLFFPSAYPDTAIIRSSVLTLSSDGKYRTGSAVEFPAIGAHDNLATDGNWGTIGFSRVAISLVGFGVSNSGSVSNDTLTIRMDTLTLIYTR